jgi:hypothetical protein
MVIRQDEGAEIPEALGHHVEHREIGRERHVLIQPCDADARLAPQRPRVRRLFSADDAQEG